MRPLALLAAMRFARYLGKRIDSKLQHHERICRDSRRCRHSKHKRRLKDYALVFGEASLLEDMCEDAVLAVEVVNA